MIKHTQIIIDGKEYPVTIEYKRMKNSYFRFKDGGFYITSSYFVPVHSLLKSLERFAPKLLKKRETFPPYSFEDNYLYFFGEKRELSPIENEQKLLKYLRKELLNYLLDKVEYYRQLMNVKNIYNVRVRNMKSRHGSNSRKTMSLSFQLSLVHYSPEIIDSVIIHELAHDKVFNHSKKFYDEIDKYCPNYKVLKRKLDKGIYQ